MTPHIQDLVGRSMDEGDLLLQLADTSQMKANVYIPEFSMHKVHAGQQVRMLIKGRMAPQTGVLSRISPATVSAAGLIPKDQLEGINPPRYYLGVVVLKNNGEMIPGMSGPAKVLVARRSLAEFCFRFGREMIERKVW